MNRYAPPPDHVGAADQAHRAGSPLEELGGSTCRGDALLAPVDLAPDAWREAGKTVCDRALIGGWDREEARRLLDMLGVSEEAGRG